jgi:rfaE bifunctional protein nucleotidyltransferase chain/domain
VNASGLFPAVGCVQFPIALGDVEQNLSQVERLIRHHAPAPQTLLVLPELWATGFDYPRTQELVRKTPEILAFMQNIADRYQVLLAGSLAEAGPTETRPRNTLFLVDHRGVVASRPKQQMFTFWQEDQFYQEGADPGPLATPYGPVAALVCYDLRFPEIARRQVFAGSRLLLVAAEWPLSRLDHWQSLLRARAIENQVVVAATNGCGTTGEMVMAGHSMIIGPDGTTLAEAGEEATVITATLDPGMVETQRRRFFPAGTRRWSGDDCNKIQPLDSLVPIIDRLRRQGSRIAFTNGCFDLLHAGHTSYLEAARRTADFLVVGLNSDASVRRLKGATRPYTPQEQRARVLAALGCVDAVVLFDEDTPLALITTLQPDVLIKGDDYEEKDIVGAAEVRAAGGRVERIPFLYDCSTTATADAIRKSG